MNALLSLALPTGPTIHPLLLNVLILLGVLALAAIISIGVLIVVAILKFFFG